MEQCADPETARQFWATHQLGVQVELKQIEMSNLDEPIQDIRKGFFFTPQFNQNSEWFMELSPNEFYDQDDKIGFLSMDPDPFTFFSIENVIKNSFDL